MSSVIMSVRLPLEMGQKLAAFSRVKNTTKSEIIKSALENFFSQEESERDSWEVGESYFGRYGSGDGGLSVTYKQRLKEKLRARHSR
jgi:hypothetical protein